MRAYRQTITSKKAILMKFKDTKETKWILCPACGEKTRVKMRKNSRLENFLLYCHRCKREFIIDVEDFKVTVSILLL